MAGEHEDHKYSTFKSILIMKVIMLIEFLCVSNESKPFLLGVRPHVPYEFQWSFRPRHRQRGRQINSEGWNAEFPTAHRGRHVPSLEKRVVDEHRIVHARPGVRRYRGVLQYG